MTAESSHQEVLSPKKRPERVTFWVGLLVLAVLLHELQWILLPFVVAGVVAYLCAPLVDRLSKKRHRAVGAAAVFLLLLVAILALGLLGAPALVRDLTQLLGDMQGTFEKLAKSAVGDATVSLFGQPANAAQIAQSAARGVRAWIEKPARIAEFTAVGFSTAFGIFLTFVLLFYLLLSGRRLIDGLFWIAPPDRRPSVEEILRRLDPMLRRYFIGVIVVMLYATVAAYAGLGLVLGLHHAVFLALMTGVLEMIPVAGPGASALIAGLVAIRHSATIGSIMSYAIYAVVLRLSIDQLLAPLVLGAASKLHPVLIIFSFFSGAALFGLPGVMLAVPMMLAAKVTLAVTRGEPTEPTKAEL